MEGSVFGARLNVDVATVLTIVSQLLREGDLIANSEFKKCGHSTQHGRYAKYVPSSSENHSCVPTAPRPSWALGHMCRVYRAVRTGP